MIFHDLINNPPAKGSGQIAARYLIKESLMNRAKILIDNKKLILKGVYKHNSDSNNIFIHVQVGSETVEKVFYDVVYEIFPLSEDISFTSSLKTAKVKIFSNIMAMNFTYTYTFNKEGLIIEFLKKKCNAKALKQKPIERNPTNSFGFEKSLIYSYHLLKHKKLDNPRLLRDMAKVDKHLERHLSTTIMSSDDKHVEYLKKKEIQDNKTKKVNKKSKGYTVKPIGARRSVQRSNRRKR